MIATTACIFFSLPSWRFHDVIMTSYLFITIPMTAYLFLTIHMTSYLQLAYISNGASLFDTYRDIPLSRILTTLWLQIVRLILHSYNILCQGRLVWCSYLSQWPSSTWRGYIVTPPSSLVIVVGVPGYQQLSVTIATFTRTWTGGQRHNNS